MTQITLTKNNLTLAKEQKAVKQHTKGRRAHHVIVIAGVSGCGKTQLIRNMSQPPQDEFTLSVMKQLDCTSNQRFQRSTLERMQRLIDPANAKYPKKRKSKYCQVLFINLTSINHNQNLKRLRQISTRTKRFDVITLYISPQEWRQRILDRLHTDNEPSMRAALIALSARISSTISDFLYHREYKKWLKEITNYKTNNNCIVNTIEQSFLECIPPQQSSRMTSNRPQMP